MSSLKVAANKSVILVDVGDRGRGAVAVVRSLTITLVFVNNSARTHHGIDGAVSNGRTSAEHEALGNGAHDARDNAAAAGLGSLHLSGDTASSRSGRGRGVARVSGSGSGGRGLGGTTSEM